MFHNVAPYGFKLTNQQLVHVPQEVVVVQEAFSLFLIHRRKGIVARLLNQKGFRTRKGAPFSDMQIDRILRSSSAIGLCHKHRSSQAYQSIVAEEIFERVATILEEQTKLKPAKKPSHIFAGLLKCFCGGKMYVYTRSPNYTCIKCKNKISANTLEEIFVASIPETLANTLCQTIKQTIKLALPENSSFRTYWSYLNAEAKQRAASLICAEIIIPNTSPEDSIKILFVTPLW